MKLYPSINKTSTSRQLGTLTFERAMVILSKDLQNGEIAIRMSHGISVGVINNHLTSIEALESEITILRNFSSEKDQIQYVQQVAKHYEDLFKTEAWAKSNDKVGDRYLNSKVTANTFPIDNRLLATETIWHNVPLAVTVLREFPVL